MRKSFIAIITPQTAYAQNASASAFAGLGSIAGAGVGCLWVMLSQEPDSLALLTETQLREWKYLLETRGLEEILSAQKQKENCLDAIAYAAAKALLKKFTQATIVWINSGFKGEPLYIKKS